MGSRGGSYQAHRKNLASHLQKLLRRTRWLVEPPRRARRQAKQWRVAVNTRSRKTAKPRSVTAVTAVSLRCGVVEGDAAAAADDARNRSLQDRQESPWRGKMRSLLLLPKKTMRLK